MTTYSSKIVLILFLGLIKATCALWAQSDAELPEPKRFISQVEVFVGPNLSFNYGNKFIENYKDENVTNRRLLKPGFAFGIGVYHPLSSRLDLNVRFQYEQKGTKNELNTPSLPDGNRNIDYEDYSYNYLAVQVSPTITIGSKKNVVLSAGLYYSKVKKIEGHGKTYDTNGTYFSEGSYQGRFFIDLRGDGTKQGFTWMPYLTSIEDNDIGTALSLGYRVFLSEKHIILFQLQDNYGLKNINKDNPYGLKEKNHSITLIIGYNFQLPPKK